MSDYGERQRAQILYNHLYFSGLSDEHIKSIVASKSYRRIIYHPNFSPRVIEWMTDSFNASSIPATNFVDEFLGKLTDPSLLWAHVFDNQLRETARAILVVLALARDGSLYLTDLRIAVREVTTLLIGKFIGSSELDRDLRILDGNFVLSRRINDELTIVNFHNPSVRDFIFSRLKSNKALFLEYLKAVPFFEMLEFGWLFVDEAEELSAPEVYFYGSFFVERLHETVYGPSSESPSQIDWEQRAKFARRSPQIFRRLLFLLEVSRSLNDGANLNSTLASLPEYLPASFKNVDLMSFITAVSESPFVDSNVRGEVLRLAYEKLCHTCPVGFLDLNMIAMFLEQNVEHQRLYGAGSGQDFFMEYYISIAERVLELKDVDLLAGEVKMFEMLAEAFSVDVAAFLPELHELIEILTEERLNDPGSWDDDDGDSYRESDAYMSGGEMDGLFSSLDNS
ncbi:MAG: hypothetical protein Q8T09_19605 [Candidatus Melainabacteria bacterium]|nr:hypothetical protein [Candidatus Melainabacteria bacterium]